MKKLNKSTINNIISFGIVIIAFVICQSMIASGAMRRSLKGQLVPICVYIVMAISLNLVVGISGELSLGHAGFMSIGAFSGIIAAAWLNALFNIESELLRLILAMVVGGVFAGIAGVLIGIPVLRLRILVNGPAGATVSDKIATFPMGFALIIFTLIVVMNLINSRSGRAIMATRDNRIAAEAMGINVTKYKMMAFVTAAVLAGMAGALYGLNFSTVAASKFKFDTSILVLVFVVLGGIGNIWGSIIAATLLTVLPELLRTFADYRMLVYAIVLILVMLVTNNPMLRSLFSRIGRRGSRDAQTQVGGADE